MIQIEEKALIFQLNQPDPSYINLIQLESFIFRRQNVILHIFELRFPTFPNSNSSGSET